MGSVSAGNCVFGAVRSNSWVRSASFFFDDRMKRAGVGCRSWSIPVLRFAKHGAAGDFVSGACGASECAGGCRPMGSPLRQNVRCGSWARWFGAGAGVRNGLLDAETRRGCSEGMGHTGGANGEATRDGLQVRAASPFRSRGRRKTRPASAGGAAPRIKHGSAIRGTYHFLRPQEHLCPTQARTLTAR